MLRSILITVVLMMSAFLQQHAAMKGVESLVPLKGIDISHYQRRINWDSVATAPESVEFAFVKATEGHGYVDSLFSRNWEALHRLGIKRGAYHYFRAYGCGYEQAHNYLSNVPFQPGDIVPVLDLEHTYGVAPEIMLEEASIWLSIVEKRLGVKPIIYTYHSFYEQHLANGIFDHYPLWIARYADDSPLLSTGKVWDIWQFSNKGRINGINTDVDMNILPGSFAALENICWYPERKTLEPQSVQNQTIATPIP